MLVTLEEVPLIWVTQLAQVHIRSCLTQLVQERLEIRLWLLLHLLPLHLLWQLNLWLHEWWLDLCSVLPLQHPRNKESLTVQMSTVWHLTLHLDSIQFKLKEELFFLIVSESNTISVDDHWCVLVDSSHINLPLFSYNTFGCTFSIVSDPSCLCWLVIQLLLFHFLVSLVLLLFLYFWWVLLMFYLRPSLTLHLPTSHGSFLVVYEVSIRDSSMVDE